MPRGKITKRSVEAVEPAESDAYLWDTELAGFGLKVTPAGRRTYLVQFRGSGRTRRVTLGRHGSPWTADQARQEAKRVLGEVAAGRDPAEVKAESKHDLSVSALCDLYLAEGVATKKASTVANDRLRIDCHVKPLLGSRRVRSVTRADVERFMQDVANGRMPRQRKSRPRGSARVRGGKGVANRVLGMLGGIFTFAVTRGLRPDNPVRGIKRFPEQRRVRFLSPAELARLGETLADAERRNVNPSAVAAIRLLCLTGCRKAEILSLRWEHVDLNAGCLRLSDSKTGAKVVTLGAPALQLLSGLPAVEGNHYVLPGAKVGHYFTGLQKVWQDLRKRAQLEDVRLHDLRHSFASVGAASGSSLPIIGALLGHRTANATARYAHLSDDPVRAAADSTSRAIERMMNGSSGDAGASAVLPLRGTSEST